MPSMTSYGPDWTYSAGTEKGRVRHVKRCFRKSESFTLRAQHTCTPPAALPTQRKPEVIPQDSISRLAALAHDLVTDEATRLVALHEERAATRFEQPAPHNVLMQYYRRKIRNAALGEFNQNHLDRTGMPEDLRIRLARLAMYSDEGRMFAYLEMIEYVREEKARVEDDETGLGHSHYDDFKKEIDYAGTLDDDIQWNMMQKNKRHRLTADRQLYAIEKLPVCAEKPTIPFTNVKPLQKKYSVTN